MKLNLDCEPQDMGVALNTCFKVMQENPTQEIGSRGAIRVRVNDVTFEVTRNDESYTVEAVI